MDAEERSLRKAIREGTPDGLYKRGDITPALAYADWLDEHGRPLEANWHRRNPATALLQEIAAAPNDRAPVLAYADWLEGRNQGADADRAAFMRLILRRAELQHQGPMQQERAEQAARETYRLLRRSAPLREELVRAAAILGEPGEPVRDYIRSIPTRGPEGEIEYIESTEHEQFNRDDPTLNFGAYAFGRIFRTGGIQSCNFNTIMNQVDPLMDELVPGENDQETVRASCALVQSLSEPVREISLTLNDNITPDALQAFTPDLPTLRRLSVTEGFLRNPDALPFLIEHLGKQPGTAHLHELYLTGFILTEKVVDANWKGEWKLNRLEIYDRLHDPEYGSGLLRKLIEKPGLEHTVIDINSRQYFSHRTLKALVQHNVNAAEEQGFRYEPPEWMNPLIHGTGLRGLHVFSNRWNPSRQSENPVAARKHGNHHFLKPEGEVSITDLSRHRSGDIGIE